MVPTNAGTEDCDKPASGNPLTDLIKARGNFFLGVSTLCSTHSGGEINSPVCLMWISSFMALHNTSLLYWTDCCAPELCCWMLTSSVHQNKTEVELRAFWRLICLQPSYRASPQAVHWGEVPLIMRPLVSAFEGQCFLPCPAGLRRKLITQSQCSALGVFNASCDN